MGLFHIILIDHCILKRGVYALMPQKLLYLLDRHTLINGHCGKSSAKFVRMNLVEAQFSANFSEADFNTTNLQPLVWLQQRNKQSFIFIFSLVQIFLEMDLRPCIKVDLALFISFSENNTLPVLEVNIIPVEFDQFTNADTS